MARVVSDSVKQAGLVKQAGWARSAAAPVPELRWDSVVTVQSAAVRDWSPEVFERPAPSAARRSVQSRKHTESRDSAPR